MSTIYKTAPTNASSFSIIVCLGVCGGCRTETKEESVPVLALNSAAFPFHMKRTTRALSPGGFKAQRK